MVGVFGVDGDAAIGEQVLREVAEFVVFAVVGGVDVVDFAREFAEDDEGGVADADDEAGEV